jgi:hypothetical protein
MSSPQSEDQAIRSLSEDPFATLRKRRRGVRVTAAAAVALGLAISGGAAAAATPSGRGPGSGRPAQVRSGTSSSVIPSTTPTGSELPA